MMQMSSRKTSARELVVTDFRARSTSQNLDLALRHQVFTPIFPEFEVGILGILENLNAPYVLLVWKMGVAFAVVQIA